MKIINYSKQSALGYAGLALLRNWLIGKSSSIVSIFNEISILTEKQANTLDVTNIKIKAVEHDIKSGYKIWSKIYDTEENILIEIEEPIVKKILEKYKSDNIHGMVHCSGGAQTKILHFVENLHIIKDNLFPVPPLFQLIQEQSKTDWKEMYQVFNCGHRMEIYVPENIAQDIIAISKSFNVDAQIVGRVEASESKKLTITSEYGVFEY